MVVVKHNQVSNEHAYFRINGVPNVPALSVDNAFHRDMYSRGVEEGLLITCGRKPITPFRSVDISEMITERGTLDDGVAFYSAVELRQSGLPLPIGFEQRYKLPLIYAYMLNSALCYVEVSRKNGMDTFFATKSYEVIQAFSHELAETEKRKKVEDYEQQLLTSHTELQSGIFEFVKLVPDRGGFKIFKAKVNTNKKDTIVIPMYSIANFIDSIIRFLGRHHVMIKYVEDGQEYQFVTSLREDILFQWLDTKNSADVKKVQESWQNPFSFTEMTLPELSRDHTFVTVRALDITSIRPLD
ncbi:hypothetical protein [Cohnella yongneupensis]|uniref:Uncharacterized protein n=1 Tax=Cohnella yongneupensis TaxID=425006 RepID=A0ABW0R0F2_9BACL